MFPETIIHKIFRQTLDFMTNSAVQEGFNSCFFRYFASADKVFISGWTFVAISVKELDQFFVMLEEFSKYYIS